MTDDFRQLKPTQSGPAQRCELPGSRSVNGSVLAEVLSSGRR